MCYINDMQGGPEKGRFLSRLFDKLLLLRDLQGTIKCFKAICNSY